MSDPLVSIVVPNYNHARFLQERLQSIRDQTFTNHEIILLDDASLDESIGILSTFAAESGAKLLVNEINSGSPFVQWNKGIRGTLGKYVWIAESDDSADPRLLELLVAALEADPSAALAFARSTVISVEGEVLRVVPPSGARESQEAWLHDFSMEGAEFIIKHLFVSCSIPNASAVLFRRDLFSEIGGADESMRLSGDWHLWVKMLLRGRVHYIAEPLNRFREAQGTSPRLAGTFKRSPIPESVKIRRLVESRLTIPRRVRRGARCYLTQQLLEFSLKCFQASGGMGPIREAVQALWSHDSLFWLSIPRVILGGVGRRILR